VVVLPSVCCAAAAARALCDVEHDRVRGFLALLLQLGPAFGKAGLLEPSSDLDGEFVAVEVLVRKTERHGTLSVGSGEGCVDQPVPTADAEVVSRAISKVEFEIDLDLELEIDLDLELEIELEIEF
jgi:hypothetical protein